MNTNEISKNWIFNQNLLKCGINEEIPRVCDGQKSPKKKHQRTEEKRKKRVENKRKSRQNEDSLYISLQ